MKCSQCSGLAKIFGPLEEGVGSVCHETDAVLWFSRDLSSIGGGGGVSLP